MKRFIHVFANLNLGGAESRVMDIYRALDRSKYQFDFLIFTNEKCFFEDEIYRLGGKIYRVPHPARNIIAHICKMFFIFKRSNVEAVHSHTSYFSGLVVLIAWLSGIQYRVTHARNQSIGKVNSTKRFLFFIGRTLCNLFSTSRLAISIEASNFLFGRHAPAIVVPNAFNYTDVRFEKQGLLSEGQAAFVNLVMVARFNPIKNHVFALNVIKQYNNQFYPQVRLHLIGSGSEQAKVATLVENLNLAGSVVFWGARDDVHELLCEFDGLLFPSIKEGLGVAALEGQAAGLPCIVSEGVPDEVDMGLGLVKRLPLITSVWVEAIRFLRRDVLLSKKIIDEAFLGRGYSIKSTTKIFLKTYGVSE